MTLRKKSAKAYAKIRGSHEYPDIKGKVEMNQMRRGVLVTAEIQGLPTNGEKCAEEIFAFHIHEGKSCSGNEKDPFADALGHYNPDGCPHPYHAGDLPPLFGSKNGYAYLSVFTDRFSLNEVIGRAIIIHARPDDFTTQPSGNAGEKIACGIIMPAFSHRRGR